MQNFISFQQTFWAVAELRVYAQPEHILECEFSTKRKGGSVKLDTLYG